MLSEGVVPMQERREKEEEICIERRVSAGCSGWSHEAKEIHSIKPFNGTFVLDGNTITIYIVSPNLLCHYSPTPTLIKHLTQY